jgi:N-acyl-D-amino-acid deacylase
MSLLLLLALSAVAPRPSVLVIKNGLVFDGSGGPGKREDVMVVGDTIRRVGHYRPHKGDRVIDARGLAVAPGFIDSHSHADGGIFEDPDAETQIRQGVTTAVVGQDGFSSVPVSDFLNHIRKNPASLNFASFIGHGSVRHTVMGDVERLSTPEERAKMVALVKQGMKDGAIGLSSGLEYIPGRYSDTAEIIDLAKAAGAAHGMYISHVRNEDNHAFQAFHELVKIAEGGHLPAEINHIKLGSSRVWGRAGEVGQIMKQEAKKGVRITADVYPYLYWQSTIRVIIMTEQFDDRAQWVQGLKDIGGPGHVLLTTYSVNPKWAGKTIAEIAKSTGRDPIAIIQEIIHSCYDKGKKGQETVVVTAMSEPDLETFIANPMISFCSDGGLHGSHPRGAGSFPRVLGVYVRQKHVIPLQEAIRKMTSLPARNFGLKGRGWIKAGYKADLVLFDPAKVLDTATTKNPQSQPIGIPTVLVNGVPVLLNGVVTHAHSGQALRRE